MSDYFRDELWQVVGEDEEGDVDGGGESDEVAGEVEFGSLKVRTWEGKSASSGGRRVEGRFF